VVTRSVPANTIVAGNPARILRATGEPGKTIKPKAREVHGIPAVWGRHPGQFRPS